MIASPSISTLFQQGIQIMKHMAQLAYLATGLAKLEPNTLATHTDTWSQLSVQLYPSCFVVYSILVFASAIAAGVKAISDWRKSQDQG